MNKLKVLSAIILLVLLVNTFVYNSPVQAAPLSVTCVGVNSYTDYYLSKPALMIFYRNGHPAASKITIQYYNAINRWETVPKDDWGVNVSAPQNKSGYWSYYFIATRWRLQPYHWQWNDDWRWKVTICE